MPRTPRFFVCVFVVLVVFWPGCLVAPDPVKAEPIPSAVVPEPAKLHPALVRLVNETDEPVKAWVFFRDKGIRSQQEYETALQAVASTYNARAIQRRALRSHAAKRGEPLFGEHDLPVAPAYVDAVSATGARVRVVSKWVNAVSVVATRAQLEKVAGLVFVSKLQPVAHSVRVAQPKPQSPDGLPSLEAGGAVRHRSSLWTSPAPTLAAESSDPRGPEDLSHPPFGAAASPGRIDYGSGEAQLAQINLIALHNEGYTGSGVMVGILDTGFHRTHEAFNHPLHPVSIVAEYDFVDDDGISEIEPGDPYGQADHGTMILGCLGAYMPGEFVGGAYDASFVLAKTEDTTDEYPAEEDNYVAGLEFIESNGADMETSSLGYIDWYTQEDLDGLTAVTTIAVNISTSLGVHHCNAAGNEYHDSNPNTSSLIAPSDGFQVITCGAVDSSGNIASFSSDGPTADGRVKPEVLARGISTHTVSPSSDTGYTTANGTSLSTPLVACAVACLVEANPHWTVDEMRDHLFYTADYYAAYGTFDPLYVRGYGVINVFAAHADCNLNEIPDNCDVDCGEPGGPCDVPGCGNSLDCNENGIPDECEVDCNGNDIPDDCDIADCPPDDPLCQDCNGNGVPDECDEPYPQQGRISLDREYYMCEATASIEVGDCGLNTDSDVVETVQVTIESDSEPAAETVTLTETGPGTGEFVGSIPLSESDGLGLLQVGEGDTVTATYTDAYDGLGGTDVVVTDVATVDCQTPVISNVQVINLEPHSATVTFDTDEPTLGLVHYGQSCDGLTEEVADPGYQTSHAVDLTGLTDGATYFYAVEAEDGAGNSSTDDNGGSCYSFTTPDVPDYFTEEFGSDNDLDNTMLMFVPDGSNDFYTGCAESITELPTDPAGGTNLVWSQGTSDDGYATLTLSGGATVPFYGNSYGTFYPGTNGYITFGSGSTGYSESLVEHFDLARIAALYDDFDPGDGGSVSWKELEDRAVVTWQDVPEWNTSNSNTFQIEMYFEGTIVVSYLTVSAADGISGLSEGEGLDPDFYETDLSEMGQCEAPDCNGNGVPDDQDIAGGTSQDCNANEVPDECDIAEGTSQDLNGNGVPDECELVNPLPEDSLGVSCTEDGECDYSARCVQGVCYAPKHRYLSIASHPAQVPNTARRIELQGDMLTWWVGAPYENGGLTLADVVSAPVYAGIGFAGEWPDLLQVTGCEIATGQTYLIQAIQTGQDVGDERNYSDTLVLHTASVWGDTVAACGGDTCLPPDEIVGLDDIMAAIKKYQGVDVAPLSWLDIDPSTGTEKPDQLVNVGDILACITGYQGGTYPGKGPLGCP